MRGSDRLGESHIVGMKGLAKRIDTLATGLHSDLTVEEMMSLDLGYAPPVSAVWDSVLIAARAVPQKALVSSRRTTMILHFAEPLGGVQADAYHLYSFEEKT